MGAGLRYIAGPLTIEAQARALVAHAASVYEEWGLSGAIGMTPRPSGRGFSLSCFGQALSHEIESASNRGRFGCPRCALTCSTPLC